MCSCAEGWSPPGYLPWWHVRGSDGGQHVPGHVEGQGRVRTGGEGGGGLHPHHPCLHTKYQRGVQVIQLWYY